MAKYNINDVIDFLKEDYLYGWQIYDTHNAVGDSMESIYHKDGVRVSVCWKNTYLEVSGLNEEDFDRLYQVYEEANPQYNEL